MIWGSVRRLQLPENWTIVSSYCYIISHYWTYLENLQQRQAFLSSNTAQAGKTWGTLPYVHDPFEDGNMALWSHFQYISQTRHPLPHQWLLPPYTYRNWCFQWLPMQYGQSVSMEFRKEDAHCSAMKSYTSFINAEPHLRQLISELSLVTWVWLSYSNRVLDTGHMYQHCLIQTFVKSPKSSWHV